MIEVARPEVTNIDYKDRFGWHWVESKPNQYGEVGTNHDITDLVGDFSEWFEEKGITLERHRIVTWVDFYKQALVTLQHPEGMDVINFHTGEPERCIEILDGRNVRSRESLYSVGATSTRFVFQTAAEILDSGELTQHMQNWMELSSLSNSHNGPATDKFLPLMPGSPSNHYELRDQVRARIPDNSGF